MKNSVLFIILFLFLSFGVILKAQDSGNLPPLNTYNRPYIHQIEPQKGGKLEFGKSSNGILPLTTSNWSLGNPWNADCPIDANGSGGHARVGCLAVGMGQIMYYWKYPTQGIGYHEYTQAPYGLISANFGNTSYDYTNMHDYTTSTETTKLLFHCGVAVDMHYGPGVSYAWSFAAIPALTSYFGYKNNAEMLHQINFTDFEWETILINELESNRPIYFQGFSQNASTGHGFICDGYQGSNIYHFNWGLGGSYNGYYALDDLSPGNANFSYNQGIIRKIEPVFDFDHDLAVYKILLPRSGNYLSEEEEVRLRIANNGNAPENNFTIQLVVNETDTISELFSQTIAPNEIIEYTFLHKVDLSVLGNYILDFNIVLSGEEYLANNSWKEPIVSSELNYCLPEYAIGCSSGDAIEGVKLLTLEKLETACSSEDGNAYSQYFELQAPEISLDSSYTIEIKSQTNNNYVSLWIDNNDNEVFDNYELFIDNYLINVSNTWTSIPFSIPQSMNLGKHPIRIRTRRDTLIDSPCNLFGYGEAEDYFVHIRDYCQKPYIFIDDFESYTSGQYLACQNEKDWTTWSQTPCSTEDALISNTNSISGNKSLLIQNGDDFVHPINNFKEGTFEISFKMYIPIGKLAYFNHLLKFNSGGSAWGQEIRFANGIAKMDAAGDNATQFSYNFDEWFDSKLIVNLDKDSAYYYHNNTFIYAWKWSYGAHDTEALDQIGGTNFWGWTGYNGNGNCYYFVDDYQVKHRFEKPEKISDINLSYSNYYQDLVLQWNYPDSLDFVIYHSLDNICFLPIDTVQNFTYTLLSPSAGKHYYYVKARCDTLISDKSSTVMGFIAYRLAAKTLLEGAYLPAIDSMRIDLSEQNNIPSEQIFNCLPWLYSGNEKLSLFPEDMVDWVLIKLYDTMNAEQINVPFDTLAGILLNDGRITDLDGSEPLAFTDTIDYHLYLKITTRNHQSILSNNACPLVGLLYSYDFTSQAEQAWQSNQKFLGNSRYGMRAGDIDANGLINSDDYLIWKSEAGKRGYFDADLNFDGEVNNFDKNDFWFPNKSPVKK